MNPIDYLRTFRIGPFSVFDFAISYLGFLVFSPLIIWLFAKCHVKITLISIMWLVLPLSILVHALFGRYTQLTQLFLDPYGNILVKVIVLFMLFMGFKDIRWVQKTK